MIRRRASPVPFAISIGLSAFLLFSVEPLIGKRLLPAFGGAATVWTTTLCFFQIVLVAGYFYGHLSATRFGRAGPWVHLGLGALGLVALVAVPEHVVERIGWLPPSLDLLRILTLLVGLPVFVVTATTPLVSSWFSASGNTEREAYWLYALSNAGSMLALIAYPLVIEPRLGLRAQTRAWIIGYAVLVATTTSAAMFGRRPIAPAVSAPDAAAPTIKRLPRARWLLFAAVPTGLLSAVTNFLTTDLVSMPLVWVCPLALYIGSFVIAFSPRGTVVIRVAVVAAPAMITLLWVLYAASGNGPLLGLVPVELAAFAIVAVALHGLLAEDRPAPAHATEFYLCIAVGGALGSAFVALLAPAIFPDLWEYPILLVLALVALAVRVPGAAVDRADLRARAISFAKRMGPYGIGATVLVLVLSRESSADRMLGLVSLSIGALLLAMSARPWLLAVTTATALVLGAVAARPKVLFRSRSFFGVTQVRRTHGGEVTTLYSGTTVHGAEWRAPEKRDRPMGYYAPGSPIADLFDVAERSATNEATERVAIVGLGGGALAAYARPSMTLAYFEIDPVVVQVATQPALFSYLRDAPIATRIVVGDARLSLRNEPDGSFDWMLLDAFSSDALPVHLLTREAIADDLRVLAHDGLLAFHISNRFYDLAPPLAAALRDLDLPVRVRASRPTPTDENDLALPTRVVAATRDVSKLAELEALGWSLAEPGPAPFTDDYANVLSTLRLP